MTRLLSILLTVAVFTVLTACATTPAEHGPSARERAQMQYIADAQRNVRIYGGHVIWINPPDFRHLDDEEGPELEPTPRPGQR